MQNRGNNSFLLRHRHEARGRDGPHPHADMGSTKDDEGRDLSADSSCRRIVIKGIVVILLSSDYIFRIEVRLGAVFSVN